MMKNPVKRSAALALLLLLLASMFLWALEGPEHDKDLLMLFTAEYREGSDDGSAKKLLVTSRAANALASAAYLCLDATSVYPKTNYAKYQNIPEGWLKFDDYEITLKKKSKDKGDDENKKGDGGAWHERFTHMGWHDFEDLLSGKKEKYEFYENGDYDLNDAAIRWYKRRYIFQQVVNELFKFNPIDEWLSLKQCEILLDCAQNRISPDDKLSASKRALIFSGGKYRDTKSGSLAAIFYYTHILGDILHNEESTSGTRMSLNEVRDELNHHLANLFGDTAVGKLKNQSLYENLKKTYGTDEKTEALKLLQSLQSNLPTLLEKEYFYKKSDIYKDYQKIKG